MKFLYITDDFSPGKSPVGIRTFELSKRLIDKNIFPIILTKKSVNYQFHTNNSLKSGLTSLKIYKTAFLEIKFLSYLLNFIFRINYYIPTWILIAYFSAKRIIKKNRNIKFIYASGPLFSTHIIGYLLKLKFNIPLILEYRDPWNYNPYTEEKKRFFDKKIDVSLERRILKSADMIITISPALSSFLLSKFPLLKNKPLFSISNGLNILEDNYNLRNKNSEMIFIFTGALYGKRSIYPLLKIISDLKKEGFFREIKFCFKIFGEYNKKFLEKIINKLEIVNLTKLGDFIPRAKALQELINCDLAIHIGENFDYPTISFKVWDYLSCRRKILFLGRDESYTATFLKENQFGVIIPINDLNRGKKILKDLILSIKNEKFNKLIDKNKIKKFTWDIKVEQFIKYIINHF